MNKICIKKNWTLSDFEEQLRKPELSTSQLVIPNNILEGGAIGHSLQLAQFILTWSRISNDLVIHTYLKKDDTKKIESFSKKNHNLAAAYYADKVLSSKEDASQDIRQNILRSISPRIDAMHAGDIKSLKYGARLDFIFIEGANKQFHGAFYRKKPTFVELQDGEAHKRCVRSSSECNRSLRSWLKEINIPNSIYNQLTEINSRNSPNEDGTIGRILIEAFENTCQHAYRDNNGAGLKRNLRCISISKWQTINSSTIENINVSSIHSQKAAKKYFYSLLQNIKVPEKAPINFLELSIFDSGSGFSETYGMKDEKSASRRTDYENVVQCFNTSESSKRQETAGKGLYRILSAVHSLGGFLRLRTSCTEAFFAATDDFNPQMEPKNFVFGELPKIAGTLLTIGIPFSK